MPLHRGLWMVDWDTCQRCGFIHPVTMLTVQKGLKVCKCHGCLDDLLVETRPRIIADVLASGEEGMREKDRIYDAIDDDIRF